MSSWNPSLRRLYTEDFEFRFEVESGSVFPWNTVPTEYLDGTNLSDEPWWQFVMAYDEIHGDDTHNPDNPLVDAALRQCALRGNVWAMMRLAIDVAENGLNDEEALRWAQRVEFALPHDSLAQIDPGAAVPDDVKKQMRADINKIKAEIFKAHPRLKKQPGPNDVGVPGVYNYCLKCGGWRDSNAPLSICENTEHFGAIAIPLNFGDSGSGDTDQGSQFCGRCGKKFADESFSFCTKCGVVRT